MVHGLFMEAMRWDFDSMTIADSLPGEMNPVRSINRIAHNDLFMGNFLNSKCCLLCGTQY